LERLPIDSDSFIFLSNVQARIWSFFLRFWHPAHVDGSGLRSCFSISKDFGLLSREWRQSNPAFSSFYWYYQLIGCLGRFGLNHIGRNPNQVEALVKRPLMPTHGILGLSHWPR
jgi:hypothetical protein